MSNTDVVRLYDPSDSLRSALDVGYRSSGDRFGVHCVGFVVFVNVAFNKVWVLVVLTENVVKVFAFVFSYLSFYGKQCLLTSCKGAIMVHRGFVVK